MGIFKKAQKERKYKPVGFVIPKPKPKIKVKKTDEEIVTEILDNSKPIVISSNFRTLEEHERLCVYWKKLKGNSHR